MRSLASRLKRLERIDRALRPRRVIVQEGHMKELPRDYRGERHVVTVSRAVDGNGKEFFEWEERPGPAPPGEAERDNGDHVIMVCVV